jgi:ASC-1-like (ASCH) protein
MYIAIFVVAVIIGVLYYLVKKYTKHVDNTVDERNNEKSIKRGKEIIFNANMSRLNNELINISKHEEIEVVDDQLLKKFRKSN